MGWGTEEQKPHPLKVLQKEKIENVGYFHAFKLLKLTFLSDIFNEENTCSKGFYHDFST